MILYLKNMFVVFIARSKLMAGPGATSYGSAWGNSPSSNYSSYGSTSCNNPWAETVSIRGKPGGGSGSCITASGLGGWIIDSMTLSAMTGPGAGSYSTGPGGVSVCAKPGMSFAGPGDYGGGGGGDCIMGLGNS